MDASNILMFDEAKTHRLRHLISIKFNYSFESILRHGRCLYTNKNFSAKFNATKSDNFICQDTP